MDKKIAIWVGIIIIIIVSAVMLLVQKNKPLDTRNAQMNDKNEQIISEKPKTEEVLCGNNTYNSDILEINGVDVVKRVAQLAGKKCTFKYLVGTTTGKNIGIEDNGEGLTGVRTVFLFDKDEDISQFKENVTKQGYLIDLNENAISKITSEFEGSSEELGKFNETAGWQTYRNEKYGFEFQYPKNWEFDYIASQESKEACTAIYPGGSDSLSIIAAMNNYDKCGVLGTEDNVKESEPVSLLDEQVVINGKSYPIKIEEIKQRNMNDELIFTKKIGVIDLNKDLRIRFETTDPEQEIIKIISTFKFIN